MVFAPRLLIVRRLRGTRHRLEGDLTNAHSRVERHRHAIEVADFERHRSGESRIHESRRRVDDDPETPEGTPPLHAHDEIIGNRNMLPRDPEHKFARLDDERFSVGNGDHPHVPHKRLRLSRIENRKLAVLVQLECVPQVQIHTRRMNMPTLRRICGTYSDPPLGNNPPNIPVGENHGKTIAEHPLASNEKSHDDGRHDGQERK